MQLRPYQNDVKQGIYDGWTQGKNHMMAVCPTGSGKTVIMSNVSLEFPGPVAMIAHRQELVSQMSLALAKCEVKHRIVGPAKLVKTIVQIHMMELNRSWYDPNSHTAVCGVDTLIRRYDTLKHWCDGVGLVMIDECFPAGTLVDGKPIETIKIGDTVNAFNEETKSMERKKVTHVFKNKAPKELVRLTVGHHVLTCTKNHPIFTTKGWVNAEDVTRNDKVYMVRKSGGFISSQNAPMEENGAGVLRKDMLDGIPVNEVISDDGRNKPQICQRQNEEEKPHAQPGDQGESVKDIKGNGTQTKDPGWQRKTTIKSRSNANDNVQNLRVSTTVCDKNRGVQETTEHPLPLQGGRGERRVQDSNRSGWEQSFITSETSPGQEKRDVLEWVGVDSVTVYQRDNHEGTHQSNESGYVYNLEVEELHTYTANDIVVHNCHHLCTDNKWGKAMGMFPYAKLLGVTATPERADGKGLGAWNDGLMDGMVVGPNMRDLINQGFLSDYRIFSPPSDVDLTDVNITNSGDYSPVKLKAAVQKSHIMGDVVSHYQRIAPGKLGITFASDVKTATDIAARFNQAGVPAEVVSAKTPDLLRNQTLQRFKNREILQLVNVDLFGEGFDLPAIEVCSMARPTQSYGLYVQQFGRALRIMPGKGKAIIIDHVGNVIRHGLPDMGRVWTLERKEKRSNGDSDAIPLKACTSCSGVYERIYKVCPYCQHVDEPAERSRPEQVDGDLHEMSDELLAQLRGEIAKIDRNPNNIEIGLKHGGTPDHVAKKVANNHMLRMNAQHELRDSMAWWAGCQRAADRPDSESYRRFYHKYGIDVLSAQALNKKDAEELNVKIRQEIGNV